MIPAPERAAADAAYIYGIPALGLVGLLILVALVVLLPALTGALRDLATVGRGAVALMGSRETAERTAEEHAEARHREAMAALADLKATVIARL